MSTLYQNCRNQIVAAYQGMAEIGYRPAAPGDGLGNITTDRHDADQILTEANVFAERWWEGEDAMDFFLGCANYTERRAMILAVETAKQCCAGGDGREWALKLARMLVEELSHHRRHHIPPTPQIKSHPVKWWELINKVETMSAFTGDGYPYVWGCIHESDYGGAVTELQASIERLTVQIPGVNA